ncbi:hypothetical protein [Hyphomicrobium sulfonivorans]|uniref:DUF2541 family protein n=1 Tax=Hyphomicrobium sulfonivorans TaxID=121290 RepID=UPI0015703244|nr:hypothetical protein [Hyphomicrobium sulfonivorans]MBI1648325.1 hypothetical protein [Hyphomicrobium sulfonivorans]NSL71140.1 hypothetical protein [Hyphomicrobium sulfonivorans]
MTIRLALSGIALMVMGAGSMPLALDATVPAIGQSLQQARTSSPLTQVQQRRRSRPVETRETAPETSALTPGQANNGEVLFGVQDVGFLVDRDVIRVGAEIGKFDRIRLRVLRNEIFITDLKVIFDDGTTETVLSDTRIRDGRKTDWIALAHKGFIKEIQLVYRSQPKLKGQARVEIFGEYQKGWLGADGEGRKYNDGWVLLGTDTAGSIGFDEVKIPVGANEGGFSQLRVSVKDRDVTMTSLSVTYEDGSTDELNANRTKIAADEAFGPVTLKQKAGIKQVEATWRSRALATSKRDRAYATVQVWGKH